MLKKIAGSALTVALTLSLSAKDKDHVISFDEVKAESSGRNVRHLISTSKKNPGDTYAYIYGKGKLVDGKSGQSLDISDTRSRTELRLKTGEYYDLNNGTISFDIAPLKKGFGVKDEAVIFEEKNEDTSFGLYLNESGRLKLKVTAMFDIVEENEGEKVVYDEQFFREQERPSIQFDNRNAVDLATDESREDAEAAAKKLEEAAKPKFEVREYDFHSFQLGDSKNWTPGEWQNIAVSWNLRKGLFVVYVNGKYAVRSFASENGRMGIFLDRGTSAGKYIKFGAGNNGLSALIDNIKISKKVIDQETK
ncbi:MAG: hypothetical protein NE334_01450 [Lentisphaeraceae bacterium]|nr:hypothetical protein [Lentisphaeraceae bacterium]